VLTYYPKWIVFLCSLGESYHEDLYVSLDEFVVSPQKVTIRYTLVKQVLTLLWHFLHTTPVQSYSCVHKYLQYLIYVYIYIHYTLYNVI
jgi:hypothetical protein